MNLLLLRPNDFVDKTHCVIKSGRRYKHVIEILKLTKNDHLCVGEQNGKIGKAQILDIRPTQIKLKVHLSQNPPAVLPVTLILALPRPPMLKRILFTVSSMGVKKIYLLNFSKVEKSLWKSSALKNDVIEEQLVLGLEQARDTRMPEVNLRSRFKPFVEDELPGILKNKICLIAHPESRQSCPTCPKGEAVIVLGPEGGFIPYEITMLEKLGFHSIHLGKRILRLETAVPVILSKMFF